MRPRTRCQRRTSRETVSEVLPRTAYRPSHAPSPRIRRARPLTSHLTCTYRATRSTPAWQDAENIQALWSAEVTKPLDSTPAPTPSSLTARGAALAARISRALIDTDAHGLMHLEVDVPRTAAAVEGAAAARRRRLHCLRSGGRVHASGGAARRRSGDSVRAPWLEAQFRPICHVS